MPSKKEKSKQVVKHEAVTYSIDAFLSFTGMTESIKKMVRNSKAKEGKKTAAQWVSSLEKMGFSLNNKEQILKQY